MNSAISNTRFEDFDITTRVSPPAWKSMPRNDEPEEEVHLLRVLYPTSHLPKPTPFPESQNPLRDVDGLVISASMMRKIENELINDQCDPHTVFISCRGLTKGTLEFEEAYLAARVRTYAKQQRPVTDPLVYTEASTENSILNFRLENMNLQIPPAPHPMAVNHLSHLMSHFGIWVIGLLGIQFFAAWRVSAYANSHLEGGRYFYFAVAIFLCLALNSTVWFSRRGNHCNAFFAPGIALYLMALLPIFILHIQTIMLAAR